MTENTRISEAIILGQHAREVTEVFGHPDDVLNDPSLTTQEKRAVLASWASWASWASDANAVPHLPALRQLPDGSIVKLADSLRTLKAPDGAEGTVHPRASGPTLLWQKPFQRRAWAPRNWSRFRRRSDDDDDPPPCPVGAATRPRDSGGGAFACAEPIFA